MLIQELALEDCRQALLQAGFGRLACASGNQPYVVPIHFCLDGDYAYSFSMPGQKVEWMRRNPLVCLEIDDVTGRDDWTSVIAFGRYEELRDTPEFQTDRLRALELLQRTAMWWQPGAVPMENHAAGPTGTAVFFRIAIERLTGHRGLPAADATARAPTNSWLGRLFHTSGSQR